MVIYVPALAPHLHAVVIYVPALDPHLHAVVIYVPALDPHLHAVVIYVPALATHLHAVVIYVPALDPHPHAVVIYVLDIVFQYLVHCLLHVHLSRLVDLGHHIDIHSVVGSVLHPEQSDLVGDLKLKPLPTPSHPMEHLL